MYALAEADDGPGLYVGGAFTSYDTVASSKIIRLLPNGSRDPSFSVGVGFNDRVTSIVPVGDGSGDIFIGGLFTEYDGINVNRIARINSTGALNNSFVQGTGFNSYVATITRSNDGSGDIFVGGHFSHYNDRGSNKFIKLSNTGAHRETDFDIGIGVNVGTTVYAIALAKDGSNDIYIGGDFGEFQGAVSNGLVRIDSDGNRDTAFNVGPGANWWIYSIVVPSDETGDIVIGGAFTAYNGNSASKIARVSSAGAFLNSFDTGSAFDSYVKPMFEVGDESLDLYVGGKFTSYNGQSAPSIIKLSNDGTQQ